MGRWIGRWGIFKKNNMGVILTVLKGSRKPGVHLVIIIAYKDVCMHYATLKLKVLHFRHLDMFINIRPLFNIMLQIGHVLVFYYF